ncbi:hypothetical protein NL676_038105 [Syzygium grande]|nr:hypothetical protein NL676_038105 [Syzygium grande]
MNKNVYKLHSHVIKTGLQDDSAASSCYHAPPPPPRACPTPALSSPVSPLPTPPSDPTPALPLLAPSPPSPQMLRRGVSPDNFTFPFVLKACSRLREMGHGLHALVAKLGLGSDVYV